ncbi:hypothetical protein DFJ73DRAFT_820859 [Zopfochytrium polystomum]|nr:hypothetical protein DFJ73DRAFT_820859 [Zopfochytrium polystomum]
MADDRNRGSDDEVEEIDFEDLSFDHPRDAVQLDPSKDSTGGIRNSKEVHPTGASDRSLRGGKSSKNSRLGEENSATDPSSRAEPKSQINNPKKRERKQRPVISDAGLHSHDEITALVDGANNTSRSSDQGLVKALKPVYKAFAAFEVVLNTANEHIVDESISVIDLSIRQRFAMLASCMITTNQAISAKYKVEAILWKTGFYARIEQIRSTNSQDLRRTTHFDYLNDLLSLGEATYQGILAALPTSLNPSNKLLPTVSKSMGYFADLARYKAVQMRHAESPPDTIREQWSCARSRYELATLAAPSNGLLYHQIALIDAQSSRRLPALFNYVRSLSVKSPFINAKDSITLLLASNRKSSESKVKRDHQRLNSLKKVPRSHREKNFAGVKLEESVESIFLRAFELLYTRISFESFGSVAELLSASLGLTRESQIISSSSRPTNWHFYTTVVAIFVLSAVTPADPLVADSKPTGQYENASNEVLEEMRSASWTFCSIIFRDTISLSAQNNRENSALPGLRVFLAWLRSAGGKWWLDRDQIISDRTLWDAVVLLHRELRVIECDAVDASGRASQTITTEDWQLRGFLPLKEIYTRQLFDNLCSSKSVTLSNVPETCETPESYSPLADLVKSVQGVPFMSLRGADLYYSHREADTFSEPMGTNGSAKIPSPSSEETMGMKRIDDEENWFGLDLEATTIASSSVLSDLKKRKSELKLAQDSRFVTADGKRSSTFPDSLDKSSTRLLFDTNCYVGDLEHVKQVIGSGWSVVVPLVVITELDGLKASNNELRAEAAHQALSYLESLLVSSIRKPSNLILLTARGTALPYLSIRTEDWSEEADPSSSNGEKTHRFQVRGVDDVLLRCCIRGIGGANNIVMLLVTEDVNLRLKARGVGVRTCGFAEVKPWLGVK